VPRFDDLDCHPRFEQHQADAGRRVVSCEEAIEAWYGRRQIVRNRRDAAGPYLMVGKTYAGRPITVVLQSAQRRGSWVAYTAWDTP
jgi:hypothetical protein